MNLVDLPLVASPAHRVVGADQPVPVLDGTLRRYVNLDNAASTPALRELKDTVDTFMHWYSSVHRGAGFKSRVATQAYEDARHIVMEFGGADPATHVAILGMNTTEAIAKLAARLELGADDVVLVSQLEHHSNDLPWRARARVEHVRADAVGQVRAGPCGALQPGDSPSRSRCIVVRWARRRAECRRHRWIVNLLIRSRRPNRRAPGIAHTTPR